MIGFPLAWNGLNWLTPPLLLSLVIPALILFRGGLVWKFPGFRDNTTVFEDLARGDIVRHHKYYITAAVLLVLLSVLVAVTNPLQQVFTRVVTIILIFASYKAHRTIYLTDLPLIHEQCVELMFFVLFYIAAFISIDTLTLVAALTTPSFLIYNVLRSSVFYYYSIASYILVIVSQVLFIVAVVTLLQESRVATPTLTYLRLDWPTLKRDLQAMKLLRTTPTGLAPGQAFSGTGHKVAAPSRAGQSSTQTRANPTERSSNASREGSLDIRAILPFSMGGTDHHGAYSALPLNATDEGDNSPHPQVLKGAFTTTNTNNTATKSSAGGDKHPPVAATAGQAKKDIEADEFNIVSL